MLSLLRIKLELKPFLVYRRESPCLKHRQVRTIFGATIPRKRGPHIPAGI